MISPEGQIAGLISQHHKVDMDDEGRVIMAVKAANPNPAERAKGYFHVKVKEAGHPAFLLTLVGGKNQPAFPNTTITKMEVPKTYGMVKDEKEAWTIW